ncbi:similar to Saccharomyces cerevisiae YDL210W UGA4 Permease that serves as a gamma-aminobutyrate (GABA) transport protein involved in the utilization of GABA as a nitrogen source [Maudiozyma saulgeensis]|uniref:Similar to Saccharomyces cerevisiae YDL210W UGA4 Permease that serves as a gamma-aminobutyrate (GABA) transport protein involved in the utilization of GABA as a nitrogen source n=1 Tax=Maudiozyma saulgeensis TaxID=1789683 RepID=A0A1X7R4N6_9SACH|nr:similar to Saccharomyces cerevisiae YDL210W UGA4 Permease that serves as a gamma-aminobutyrate (GABA) transport protein involved in the utilization of GABA as a nitrogen source [Kazachstania saulgeensis]
MSEIKLQKIHEDRITVDEDYGSVTEIGGDIRALRSVQSKTGAGEVNYINSAGVADDSQLLAEIGYKQELNRQFSTIQVFGIAFSIMGLLPSIASVMAGGLAGGSVSLIWGWFISGFFILLIGMTMAENASAIPTAGGLYYWTYYYAPVGYKEVFSFIIGCSNSIALAAGICSVNYGLAEEILAAVILTKDGNFVPTNGMLYGIFAAAVVSMAFMTSIGSKAIARIQAFSISANLFLIVLLFIALPIGTKKNMGGFNDGSFIFGKYQNFSDWNNGWQFCLAGLMPAIWTIGSFDSCVHQSEEAKDAKKSVPIGIIGSITACWILGWMVLICLMACVSPDLDRIINNPYGFALAQIIFDSLGKKWAIAFMSLIAFCQFLMGSSIVIAISRQAYAFARDDGLPFSRYIKRVDQRYHVPYFAIMFSCTLALLLGLLTLIDSVAANALFSLAVAGNYVSWSTPTIMRLTFGKDLFRPGPFYLGDFWSPVVSWIGVIFQYFIILLVMFPSQQHGLEKSTMNYACVIGPGMWILSWVYYKVYKKKYYHGPKTNLSDEQFIDTVGSQVIDEILSPHETKGSLIAKP